MKMYNSNIHLFGMAFTSLYCLKYTKMKLLEILIHIDDSDILNILILNLDTYFRGLEVLNS